MKKQRKHNDRNDKKNHVCVCSIGVGSLAKWDGGVIDQDVS